MDKPKILIVDDEANARAALAEILKQEGYGVETAADGFKALAKLVEFEPDLVVTDLKMPGMDGVELLRKVKELDAETPVVLMTAFGAVETAVSAMREGAADYLTKPIDYKQLTRVLNKYRLRLSCDRSQPGHALIAEDDLATRSIFQRMLMKEGWTVAAAENGRIALECMEQQKPDLILLDLMMPEMDGFQFITELRSRPDYCSIPVVVVTAMDLTIAEQQQLNGCVEQILQKGTYSRDALLREVREVVFAHTHLSCKGGEDPHG